MDETTQRFPVADDLHLSGDVVGDESAPCVLLLHGGGQTRHSWQGTARWLAEAGFRAIALDLRGHGESDWASDGDYTIDAYAADVRALVAHVGGRPALVGASLGGMASLAAVGEEPRVDCSALVLVDIAPHMEEEGKDRIGGFMRSRPDGFASVEEAADAVAEFLPHRPRPRDPGGLLKNLRRMPNGRYRWHWDPAFMSSGLGQQVNRPDRFEDAARTLEIPTLLVRGGMSEIISERSVAEFRALVPSAEYVNVPRASHMVAGDRNDPFSAGVVEFLTRRVLETPR